MIPFRVEFTPGAPLHEQATYAARKAMVAGQMRPGDPFPSVRALSRELRINPNTAHRIVSDLLAEGLIEVRVGVGTVVAQMPRSTAAERSKLLQGEIEQLVVQSRRLGLELDEILGAVERQWQKLGAYDPQVQSGKGGRRRP